MEQTLSFDFDGATYEFQFDHSRLSGQVARVFAFMAFGYWHTLDEIAAATGDPCQSVSARLRDLRKPRFGGHTIDRRRRGDPKDGLFEYRLKPQ